MFCLSCLMQLLIWHDNACTRYLSVRKLHVILWLINSGSNEILILVASKLFILPNAQEGFLYDTGDIEFLSVRCDFCLRVRLSKSVLTVLLI